MAVPATHFEALYREDPDPWGFATSTYEQAKYARTMRALRGRRYGRALELGCSIGVLTGLVADHCDALVACDGAPTAVAAARERLAAHAHVEVLTAELPDALPAGPWDLVVASEVLYYLEADELSRMLDLLEEAIVPGGTLLAVHWTRPTTTHPLQGDEVHRMIVGRAAYSRTLSERRSSYRIDRFVRR